MNTRSSTEMIQSTLEPLEKHVARFVDQDGNFTPSTICAGLTKIHGSHPYAKGVAIATFNATHSDGTFYPISSATFAKHPCSAFAKYLHLGTTRIWDANGKINEDNWNKMVTYAAENQHNDASILLQSTLKKYLTYCYYNDKEDTTTGRNASHLFSSKAIQGYAATAAWDEVFDRLTCGWQPLADKPSELEPYITMSLVREFFEDSSLVFKKAEEKSLPVPKPTQLNATKPTTM